jgi:hypothetical protein
VTGDTERIRNKKAARGACFAFLDFAREFEDTLAEVKMAVKRARRHDLY